MYKPVILCVDDEKMVLDSLKEQLRSGLNGEHIIEVAESGAEALEIMEEFAEDNLELVVIISDHIMPNMKGDELLKNIHRISPKTLKILLTGQADADAVGEIVNHVGLYRYISKPWHADDLIMTVREAVRSYTQDKKLEEQNKILKKTNRELELLNKAYERFVPREFLRFLARKSIVEVGLGDQIQAEMTILFADIRSFTSISEQMTPQENFDFLNAYLRRVGPIIRNCRGFIDKYIGDAVMALFPSQASDALQAAIEMQRSVAEYNEYRQQQDLYPFRIGVGLHTGYMMLGTVGEMERMDVTVISDAVNLASRIENLTKLYGASILISQEVLLRIEEPIQYTFRYLDRIRVKGRKEPVSIFEILDGEPEQTKALKLKTYPDFEKGLRHYKRKEFLEAAHYFRRVLDCHPEDKVAEIYLTRIKQFTEYSHLTPNWEGVAVLS